MRVPTPRATALVRRGFKRLERLQQEPLLWVTLTRSVAVIAVASCQAATMPSMSSCLPVPEFGCGFGGPRCGAGGCPCSPLASSLTCGGGGGDAWAAVLVPLLPMSK